MKKSLTLYVDKDQLKEDGIIPLAVASDMSVDRDGDIVDPAGLDFANYERNPVLLYAHDYRSDPIGKTIAIKKEGSRVLFTPQLAIDISPRAKMYFDMIKAGILNAFSIGFIVKEWTDRDNGAGGKTRIFTKTELLEISLVPVPANANALVLAREYTGKLEGDQKEMGESVLKEMELAATQPKGVDEMLAEITKNIGEVKTIAEAAQTTATEAKEAASTKAPIGDANNGDVSGEEALTVKEVTKHPEFRKAVLRVVDQAVGTGLRDANRRT